MNSIKIQKSKLVQIDPEKWKLDIIKKKPIDYIIDDEESVKLDFDDDISSCPPTSARDE